jgi:sec-independent protein translocase protein TatB
VFNIGGSEFMIIALVALLVVGPEKMPDLARKAGKLMGELRRMSSGFQSEVREAFGEPLDAVTEMKSQFTAAANDFRSTITEVAGMGTDAAKPVSRPNPWQLAREAEAAKRAPWDPPALGTPAGDLPAPMPGMARPEPMVPMAPPSGPSLAAPTLVAAPVTVEQ